MRRIIPILVLAAAWATLGFTADQRILTETIRADGIDSISIEAGVGRLDIETGDDDEISIEIILKPRRGGFFSSMKRAQEEVDEAEIVSETVGDRLYLEVRSSSGDRRFEERWAVRMPARIALDAELGVGDVIVVGLEGGVRLDVGVGEVDADVDGGDIDVKIGVGDANISGSADAFGSADARGGVGGAEIRVRGDRVSEGGFVGHHASWQGEGRYEIEVEVGVGDASIELE